MAGLAVTACSEPASSPPAPLTELQALESPAGQGSEGPHLSSHGDELILSWLEPVSPPGPAGDGSPLYELRVSALQDGGAWSPPGTVARSDRFFVNWADVPSVETFGDVWVAHWLLRGDAGGYDYGVRLAHSDDRGTTWSEAWTPHGDGTPTEHGFVSFYPLARGDEGTPSRVGVVWLDGRRYAAGADGRPPTEEMTLRSRHFVPGARRGGEEVVDERVCDCCQTDAAATAAGPVVVYRDRSRDEIRDVRVRRYVDGGWTEGRPVHEDGWRIAACPVNGPAVAARDSAVAVAWFTGADDTPRVRVAFSRDAGATFGPPVEVDDGAPGGRVDVVLLADGSALVSWLERLGEGGAEVRVRRVWPDGTRSAHSTVARSEAARASGFPRMVRGPEDTVVFAWTDSRDEPSRVRVASARLVEPAQRP